MRKPNLKQKLKTMDRKEVLVAAAVIVMILLVCAAAFFLLGGSDEEEGPSLDQVLEEKLTAYETDLRDSLGSLDTNEDVAQYLLTWAKNKEITATMDSAGNVIYTLKASENVQDAQPAAVVCCFDASNMETYIEEMSVALTIAKNAQNHGALNVIFMPEVNGDKSGVQALDAGHFKENTAIFCLGHAASARVSTITGSYQHITITHKLSYHKPTYNKAYKITLKNCPAESIFGKYDATLNPIKILGNVLANFKSTSLLFELSSFYGGANENQSPSKASMTVVINESDSEKFEKKMDTTIEKLYEKYQDDYPDMEYTYEETDLPSRVLDGEDTDNLVSLMYTVFNGVYNRDDEGTIIALTNIGKISTKDSRLKIDIAAMSSDQVMLDEISEAYETICGLCDVKYSVKSEYPLYDASDDEETLTLLSSFEEAFVEFTGDYEMIQQDTAVLTAAAFLHEKNEDLPILFCGVTTKTKHKFAGSIVTWLDQGLEEEE